MLCKNAGENHTVNLPLVHVTWVRGSPLGAHNQLVATGTPSSCIISDSTPHVNQRIHVYFAQHVSTQLALNLQSQPKSSVSPTPCQKPCQINANVISLLLWVSFPLPFS